MNIKFDQPDTNSVSKDVSQEDILNAMNKLSSMIENDKKNLGLETNGNRNDSSTDNYARFTSNFSDDEGSPDVDYLNEVFFKKNILL